MQQLQNGGASRRQMQSGETILADKSVHSCCFGGVRANSVVVKRFISLRWLYWRYVPCRTEWDGSWWQMLKHGRAGVPMEVMGLMLGEFVDDYTVSPLPHSSEVSWSIDLMCGCFRYASVRYHRHCRVRWSCLPNENAGYVETDRTVRLSYTGGILLIIDRRWLLDGITLIQVSDVGYQVSTSIPSR
jgi:hypothetical protein